VWDLTLNPKRLIYYTYQVFYARQIEVKKGNMKFKVIFSPICLPLLFALLNLSNTLVIQNIPVWIFYSTSVYQYLLEECGSLQKGLNGIKRKEKKNYLFHLNTYIYCMH